MNKNITYSLHHQVFVWSFFFAFSFWTTALLLCETNKTYASAVTNLSMYPQSITVSQGNMFNADIMLDTGDANIDAVDIFSLHYDPTILELQDADPSTPGLQIIAGSIFKLTLINTVNPANGTVQFSQVSTGGSIFKGAGKLASVMFKAIADGTSQVTIDFSQIGSGGDSNVAGDGTDKLMIVNNAVYTVLTPDSAGSPTTHYNFGPVTLRLGSRGDGVKELQKFLNNNLNLGLSIDGVLGPKTIAVIKKWQTDHNLVPDGLVGAKTKAMMNMQ